MREFSTRSIGRINPGVENDIKTLATRKNHLLSSACLLALTMGYPLAGPAAAATYYVGDQSALRSAITTANADGDPSSTIVMTTNFSVDTIGLPGATKPVTINTNGFTLSTAGNNSITFQNGVGTSTLEGMITGAGIAANSVGAVIAIKGNASVVNNGTIQGGASTAGSGAPGVDLSGPPLGTPTLVNNGTIRGGDGTTSGGLGVLVRAGSNPITNTGTIVGGNGAQAIKANSTATNLGIVNSGTIRAGTGQADAIELAAASTGALTLELQAGSQIFGNVVGGAGVNDKLILGGSNDAAFDVSAIGDTAQYRFFNNFQKTGASTWTLSGATTALTPWQLLDGTLSVSSDAALGDAAGGLTFNGGVLQVTGTSFTSTARTITWGAAGGGIDIAAPDNVFALNQVITGNGPLDKLGDGTLLLGGDSSAFTGTTQILAGTLEVDGSLCGPVSVLSSATLAGTGTVCDATNFTGGTISPGSGGIGTLTVNGNYTSNGGNLAIETVLGNDSSPSDLLVITGNTVLGTGQTKVFVTNLGGTGAETTGDGIKIVQVDGTSAAGVFGLGAPMIAGAYNYELFQNGITDPTDGDWYLRAAGLAPPVPIYQNYPNFMLDMIEMPTFQQRRGDAYMSSPGTDSSTAAGPTANGTHNPSSAANVWSRIEAPLGHYEGSSDTGMAYDLSRVLVQVGIDGLLSETGNGRLIAGINGQYGHGNAQISSDVGSGHNSTDSFGGGVTLSWLGNSGTYIDAQASAHYLRSDLSSDTVGTLVNDNQGLGYGMSIEAGHKVNLNDAWSLTPQAQLAYTSVGFDSFTDPYGAQVSLVKGESLKGRIGLALGHDSHDGDTQTHVYSIANLTYEFLGEQSIDVSGTNISFDPQKFGGELGLGGTYAWAGGKYALQAEALGQSSFAGSYGVKGTIGFSTKF